MSFTNRYLDILIRKIRNLMYLQLQQSSCYRNSPQSTIILKTMYAQKLPYTHSELCGDVASMSENGSIKDWKPFDSNDVVKCGELVPDLSFWESVYDTRFVPVHSNQFATGILSWGLLDKLNHIKAREMDLPFYLLETLALYNYCLPGHPARRVDPQYKIPLCFCIDDRGLYFDSSKISRLEQLLSDKTFTLTVTERAQAASLREFVTTRAITKYMFLPIREPTKSEIGPINRKKVLIIEQGFYDYAVLFQGGTVKDFEQMVKTAILENPNSDILIKRHPDLKKEENHKYLENSKNVYFIDFPINPYALFKYVDKVYVFSSGVGFEALMAGKEVVVFGQPFYMGWGLTDDRRPLSRRKVKRSIDDLVWAVYFWYQRYKILLGNNKARPGSAEEAVEQQLKFKKLIES